MNATVTKPVTSQAPTGEASAYEQARAAMVSAGDLWHASKTRLAELAEWRTHQPRDASTDQEYNTLMADQSRLERQKQIADREWVHQQDLQKAAVQRERLARLPRARAEAEQAILDYEEALTNLITVAMEAQPYIHAYTALVSDIEKVSGIGSARPHYDPTLRIVNLSSIMGNSSPLSALNEQLHLPSIR